MGHAMGSEEQRKQPTCPVCRTPATEPFYQVPTVPVQSVRLLRTREEALAFPSGDLSLSFCQGCGFIWNRDFDESCLDYGLDYEETQGFSATFRKFQQGLAEDLLTRHDLAGKHVVEIGCGKGEFLALLCELGAERGTGLDPAYLPERNASPAADRMTVLREVLSEAHGGLGGDLLCCKMTLEHVADPRRFLELSQQLLAPPSAAALFFQVPEVMRILEEGAFWDIYYEHCSYFSPGTLARLFRARGMAVTALWRGYGDQYLMIEAKSGGVDRQHEIEETVDDLAATVRRFGQTAAALRGDWSRYLAEQAQQGKSVALWGGGSKAVAFLTAMGTAGAAVSVVDINPHKAGCFLPGSGHEVLAPDALRAVPPDTVVVLNPLYRREVAATLAELDVTADLRTVNDRPGQRAA